MLVSAAVQMVALAAASSWAPAVGAAKQPAPRVAAALIQTVTCATPGAHASKACPSAQPQPAAGAAGAVAERVAVPGGSKQCPESGAGAACGTRTPVPESGTSAVPSGRAACPADPQKTVAPAPGSCAAPDSAGSSATAPTPAGATPSPVAAPASPSPPKNTGRYVQTPGVQPSVPVPGTAKLTLTADQKLLAYGSTTVLEARSSVNVTGTPWAIEIFDRTSNALVGACAQSGDCSVAYTGKTGVHQFTAYVTAPTQSVPAAGAAPASNTVGVRWLGVGLVVNEPSVVAPGKPITFTAFASEDVGALGYRVELHDATTGRLLTYCSQGAICSTSLVEQSSGVHAVFASLEPHAPALKQGAANVRASSGDVYGTWVGVHLDATTTTNAPGAVVWLTATANTDLSHTPWTIYIFRQDGQQIGQPCNATSCTASVTVRAGDSSQFQAVVARNLNIPLVQGPLAKALAQVPVKTSRLQIVASSALVKPVRILWGVDSCQPSTMDPAGNTGMYPQVVAAYGGAPDFWGRYLTTTYNCPGLSPAEISSAHAHHMGILPIYDDYDCSAVQGYQTGKAYAAAAAAQSIADGVPAGEGIVVDIEPPGDACPGAANVDPAFLQGWHDGITQAHYLPIYYGDATPGSAFQQGWCTLVAAHPDFASDSYIWSFEPSLLGSYSKASAPGYNPNFIGCGGHQFAWQFELSAGSSPNVDTDEALSRLPIWYP